MAMNEDEDEFDTEEGDEAEVPKEPGLPVVTVSRVVSVDAKQNLGDGKKLAVKSNSTGIRLSYTRRVKGYYRGTEQKTESVTIPHKYFDQFYTILTAVAEAKNGDE